jgi:hypothetical protein
MRNQVVVSMLLLCVGFAGTSAVGAEAEPETLDPLRVEASRLRDLRTTMLKAQDRFLDLYNKLNTDHRQRVACSEQAPTGSRLAKRRCSTRAQDDITQEQAQGLMQSMEASGAFGGAEALRREERANQLEGKQLNGASLSADEQNELRALQNPTLDYTTKDGTLKGEDESSRFANNLQSLFEKNPELKALGDAYFEARRRFLAAGGQ